MWLTVRSLTRGTPPIVGGKTQMSATSPPTIDNLTGPSNLPIELLRLIFRYCTEFEDLPVGTVVSFRAHPTWIVVTHVCSR
jgi:hypothetical protein